jgi:MarR family transcriptional regulator, organic hydroperoxide resistance regulator
MSHQNIRFCLTLHRAYGTLRLKLDEDLGTWHGIDFDDYALLQSLAARADNPPRLADLATQLAMSRSAMLRRLRPLEKIGLIACHGSVTERRVAVRPAGIALVNTAHDTVNASCERLASMEQVAVLHQALLQSRLAPQATI